jgi:hypothetical protein
VTLLVIAVAFMNIMSKTLQSSNFKKAATLTFDIQQAKQKRKCGKTPVLRRSCRIKITNSVANNTEHTQCFKGLLFTAYTAGKYTLYI